MKTKHGYGLIVGKWRKAHLKEALRRAQNKKDRRAARQLAARGTILKG